MSGLLFLFDEGDIVTPPPDPDPDPDPDPEPQPEYIQAVATIWSVVTSEPKVSRRRQVATLI